MSLEPFCSAGPSYQAMQDSWMAALSAFRSSRWRWATVRRLLRWMEHPSLRHSHRPGPDWRAVGRVCVDVPTSSPPWMRVQRLICPLRRPLWMDC